MCHTLHLVEDSWGNIGYTEEKHTALWTISYPRKIVILSWHTKRQKPNGQTPASPFKRSNPLPLFPQWPKWMVSSVEIEDIGATGAEISHTTGSHSERRMLVGGCSKDIMQLFTLHWICYIGISPCEIGTAAADGGRSRSRIIFAPIVGCDMSLPSLTNSPGLEYPGKTLFET